MSVRHVGALYPDSWRYRKTSFLAWKCHLPSFFYQIPRGTPSAWAQNTWGWEKFEIFNRNRCLSWKRYEIGYGCYRTLIGSHSWRIDLCRFRWPWVTPNPGFKVSVYFVSRISHKWGNGTKLLQSTNRKPYPIFPMIPLSMTLSDSWSGFLGHDIFRHWISHKRYEIET